MILVVPQRSRTKAWVVLVVVLLLAVVGSVSYLAWRQSVPGVRATLQAPRFLGHNTSFMVTLEAARGNLHRSEVRVVQGGKAVTVATADAAGTARAASRHHRERGPRSQGGWRHAGGLGQRRLLASAAQERGRAGLAAGDDRPHAAAR
jgi:hypothetical protein